MCIISGGDVQPGPPGPLHTVHPVRPLPAQGGPTALLPVNISIHTESTRRPMKIFFVINSLSDGCFI
jgi:hypothetical protein